MNKLAVYLLIYSIIFLGSMYYFDLNDPKAINLKDAYSNGEKAKIVGYIGTEDGIYVVCQIGNYKYNVYVNPEVDSLMYTTDLPTINKLYKFKLSQHNSIILDNEYE